MRPQRAAKFRCADWLDAGVGKKVHRFFVVVRLLDARWATFISTISQKLCASDAEERQRARFEPTASGENAIVGSAVDLCEDGVVESLTAAGSACYDVDAWAEDKALLRNNLSAVPGPRARWGGLRRPPCFTRTSISAECDRPQRGLGDGVPH